MANIFKTLLRASRLTRKGRPISAALELQKALALPGKVKRKPPAKPKTTARGKGTTAPAKRPAPGTFTDGTFSCSHGDLAYKLYTPMGSARRRLPLVVMLHGCSQTSSDFAVGTRMNMLADEHGVLILYPQQSQKANFARCWNWHKVENQVRGRGEPAAIATLTRHALALARGNPERVYIAGLSAGAAAAAIVGAAYPDLYVAIGVHSGVALGDIRSLGEAISAMRGNTRSASMDRLPRQLPTIVFHGDDDRVVHPSNAAGFLLNLERSRPGPLISQCTSGKSDRGRDFSRKQYRSAAGEVLLEDWTIYGSGHGWSGGNPAGSYTDPLGPDASREMLRFFLSKRRIAKKARSSPASAALKK